MNYFSSPTGNRDNEACAKEPIHVCGLIQPFGACLALDQSRRAIVRATENTYVLIGRHAKDLLGVSITEIFGPEEQIRIASKIDSLKEGDRIRETVRCEVRNSYQYFDLEAHVRRGVVIVELETHDTQQQVLLSSPVVHGAIERLQYSKDLTGLCSVAVEEVQKLTGYDRVMIYRFDENWNGNVIAEKLGRPNVDSYQGLWFPSSDIPPQARQLFYENWVRMIPDSDFTPVKFFSSDSETGPLDQTLSILRSPAPVHVEYLKNMGVGASLTISIRKDEKLWGLIACHHEKPKLVKASERITCEFIGRLVSSLISCKAAFEDYDYRVRLRKIHRDLVQQMGGEEDFVRGLVKHSPNLLDLTNSSGAAAALYFEGKWTVIGRVPKLHEINALVRWLKEQEMPNGFLQTNILPRIWPPAKEFKDVAAGVIAVSIPKSEDNFILWFRPEIVQTVNWAGNPDKPVSTDPKTMRLHPRKSFSIWKEEVTDAALPWKDAELEAATELRRSVIELDLERQFKKERRARADADMERRRVEFLAEVSKALSENLDYETISKSIGNFSVRDFCDWCVLTLIKDEKSERALIRHATPEGQRVANELVHFEPIGRDHFVFEEVAESKAGLLVTTIEPTWLKTYAVSDEYYSFLRNTLRIRSYIAAPLISRGKLIGIIEFVNADNQRVFNEKDLNLATELALRAAVAIDNAQLFLKARELYEQAQKANHLKEEVLAVVSHDLKNPVRAMAFNLDMVRKLRNDSSSYNEGRLDRVYEMMEASNKQMGQLIQDLLDVTKLESKLSLDIEKVDTDVEEMIGEVVSVLSSVAEYKAQRILVSVPQGCRLYCDSKRLQQVLSNLIGNALKFAPQGSVVEVQVSQHAKQTIFAVIDDGPGISVEQRERVFERFWQGKRESREGLGLGLAIARGIVEAHSGKIWVDGHAGRGARFIFELPNH